VTTYTTKNGLSHNGVRAIYEDRAGNVWIGTQGGGLNRFRDGRFDTYVFKDAGAQNDVRAIYEDRQGRLWMGGALGQSSLYQFKDGTLVPFLREDGTPFPVMIYTLLEDRKGSLWIGAARELIQLRDGKITSFRTEDGFSGFNVMSLYEDREGALWIGTYGGGLGRFKDGSFTNYSVREGLFDAVVYQILEDDRGCLWLSGNKGIFCVRKRELNELADGKIKSVSCVPYGIADGMKTIECSGAHQSAGCKTKDGKLWFPTIQGVAVIDPNNVPTNTLAPPVHIEHALIDGETVDLRRDITAPPGKGELEFHYTALSFLDPSKVTFKYQLEGYDDEWVEAGARREAFYTNIPPGQYRFRVKACNNNGVWNEAGAAIEFSLEPHFYQTGWFYALWAMVLVVVGPSIYWLRVRQLRARQKALETVVAQRTQELAELNQSLERRVDEGVRALAEAERMAAYGQMVAGVAHEVRHPIFALRTAAYVLKQNFEDRSMAEMVLTTIERETNRMMNVVDDLLEFARPKALLLAPTDLHQIVQEAVETYRAENGPPPLNIVVEAVPGLPPVEVDRSRMVQVLVNLIQNAAKHAEGATTVTLSVNGLGETTEHPSQVCLRVKDDGAGIAPEHLPQVFDPFFTTGRGTGLGLSIVQRIVKEHGGTITAQSEPGHGAVFTISLPAKPPEQNDERPKTQD
jgi:signal transduction histidine kinase/streptogramin lyase